jgi:hypothetical protein
MSTKHTGRQSKKLKRKLGTKHSRKDGDKNWDEQCMNCGESPTVHPTGLCGPCCFGEAETYGGNW